VDGTIDGTTIEAITTILGLALQNLKKGHQLDKWLREFPMSSTLRTFIIVAAGETISKSI
jgi:hypothetical protein